MNLLIHDLDPAAADAAARACSPERGWVVLGPDGNLRPCVGCFGCWLKTPGRCVIRDGYGDMGALLAGCEGLILVSRCCYGGPSPFVKNLIDRSIGYVHPDFVIREGEMHHRRRYDKALHLTACFYGEGVTAEERETAEQWVRAAADNLYCDVDRVAFSEAPGGWGEEL